MATTSCSTQHASDFAISLLHEILTVRHDVIPLNSWRSAESCYIFFNWCVHIVMLNVKHSASDRLWVAGTSTRAFNYARAQGKYRYFGHIMPLPGCNLFRAEL